MSLEEDYLELFDELKTKSQHNTIKNSTILELLDLTLLDLNASEKDIDILNKKANQHQVAAICIMPQHLSFIKPKSVHLATVVNFPSGKQETQEILSTIDLLLSSTNIDEIDYVFPYQSYLMDDKKYALSQCKQAFQRCHQQNVKFKVILETGAFPSLEDIYQASSDIIAQGCDFLKTSTGKITPGATLSAAFVMLKAIKDSQQNCGIKISGGIKQREQALSYINLAELLCNKTVNKHWFRIGASSLIEELHPFS